MTIDTTVVSNVPPTRWTLSIEPVPRGTAGAVAAALQGLLPQLSWETQPSRAGARGPRSLHERLSVSLSASAAHPQPNRCLALAARRLSEALSDVAMPEPTALEPQVENAGPPRDPLLDQPITRLGLALRVESALRDQGLLAVRDLVERGEAGLLRCPQLGRRAVGDIRMALAERGMLLPR